MSNAFTPLYISAPSRIGGKIVIIVRDPKMAILSWKTTFEALQSTTENQSRAWKLIASAILQSANNCMIIRYEDLIQNPIAILKKITQYVGVEYSLRTPLPSITRYSEIEYLKRKTLNIPATRKTQKAIMRICKHEAKKLGYS